MAEEPRGLPAAFVTKEQVEESLSNLETLKADGSITEEQYAISRKEYQERLGAAVREVSRIKNELRKQLEANERDIEACKEELASLEARYGVGELPPEEYQRAEGELRTELEGLERDSQALQRLIEANCSADIGVTARKPQIAAELPSVTKAVPPEGRAKPRRVKLLAAIGGVVVVGVVVAVLLLGPPWARGGTLFPPESKEEAGVPSETYEIAEVIIPVDIEGAAGVGSLHLELLYDWAVLHAIHAENGEAAANAMLEYSVDSPGQVVIGMISSDGISEDGSLVMVTFEIGEVSNATTFLELRNIKAHHAATFAEISTSTSDGIFDPIGHRLGEPGSLQGPRIVFTAIARE